jgi:hypothetical protein
MTPDPTNLGPEVSNIIQQMKVVLDRIQQAQNDPKKVQQAVDDARKHLDGIGKTTGPGVGSQGTMSQR